MSKKLFFSKKYIFLQNLLYRSIYLSEKNKALGKFNNFVIKSEKSLSLNSQTSLEVWVPQHSWGYKAVQLAPVPLALFREKDGGWKKKKRLPLYGNNKKIKKNLYKDSFKLFNSYFYKNFNLINSEVKKNSLTKNFFNLKNLNYIKKIKLQTSKNEKKFINSNLNISNRNLPYKKSFFCYWLLPFIGFVSCFTTINSYLFLTSNGFTKNELNHFFLLQNIGIKVQPFRAFESSKVHASTNSCLVTPNFQYKSLKSSISERKITKNLEINSINISYFQSFSKNQTINNTHFKNSSLNKDYSQKKLTSNSLKVIIQKLYNFYYKNLEKNIMTPENQNSQDFNNFINKLKNFSSNNLDVNTRNYLPFFYHNSMVPLNNIKIKESTFKTIWLNSSLNIYSLSNQSKLKSNQFFSNSKKVFEFSFKKSLHNFDLQLVPVNLASLTEKAGVWGFLSIINKDFLLPTSKLKNTFNSFLNNQYFSFGQKLEKNTYSILNDLTFLPSFYKSSANFNKNFNITNLCFLLEIDKSSVFTNLLNKQIPKNPILSFQTASIVLDRLINPNFINELDNWISQNLVEQIKAYLLNFKKSKILHLIMENKINFNRFNSTTKVLHNKRKLPSDELEVDKIFSSLSIFNFSYATKVDSFEFYNYKKNKINFRTNVNPPLWIDFKNSNIKKNKNLVENTIFFLIKKKTPIIQNKNFQIKKGTWFKSPFLQNQLINNNKNIILKKISDSKQVDFISNFYKTKKTDLFVNNKINFKLKKLKNIIKLVKKTFYKPVLSCLDVETSLSTNIINIFNNLKENEDLITFIRENEDLTKCNKDCLYYLIFNSFSNSLEKIITENFIKKRFSLDKFRLYKDKMDNNKIQKFFSSRLSFKKKINNLKPLNCIQISKNKLFINKPLGWLTYFNNLINFPIYHQKFPFLINTKNSSSSLTKLPWKFVYPSYAEVNSAATSSFCDPRAVLHPSIAELDKVALHRSAMLGEQRAQKELSVLAHSWVRPQHIWLAPSIAGLAPSRAGLDTDIDGDKTFHSFATLGLKSYIKNNFSIIKLNNPIWITNLNSSVSNFKNIENKKKNKFFFVDSLFVKKIFHKKERKSYLLKYCLKNKIDKILQNKPSNLVFSKKNNLNNILKSNQKTDNSLQSKLIKENLTKKLIHKKQSNLRYPTSLKTRMILDLNLPINRNLITPFRYLRNITSFSNYINFLSTKLQKNFLNPSNSKSQKKMKKTQFSFLYVSNAKINFIKTNNDKAYHLNKFEKQGLVPKIGANRREPILATYPNVGKEKQFKVEEEEEQIYKLIPPFIKKLNLSKLLERSSWYASFGIIPGNKKNFSLKLPKSTSIFSGLNRKIIKFRNYRDFSKPKISLIFYKNNSKVYSQRILKNLIKLNKNKSFCLQKFYKLGIINSPEKNKLRNNFNSLDLRVINKKYLIKLFNKTKFKLKNKQFKSFKSLKLEKIFRSYLSKKISRINSLHQFKNKISFLNDTLNSSLCFKTLKNLKIKLINKLMLKSEFYFKKEIKVLRLIKDLKNIKRLESNSLMTLLNKKIFIKTRRKMNSKVKNFVSEPTAISQAFFDLRARDSAKLGNPNLLLKNCIFRKKTYGKITILPYSSENFSYLLDKLPTLNRINPWRFLANNETFFMNNQNESNEYLENLAGKLKLNKVYKHSLTKSLSEHFYEIIVTNKFKNFYENSVDLSLKNKKNKYFFRYLDRLDNRKYLKKKHRKKKRRNEVRRGKKRDRSSLRPVWFRYNLYTRFLTLRHFEKEKSLTIKRKNSKKLFFNNTKLLQFYSNFTNIQKNNLKYENLIHVYHELKNSYKTTNLNLLRQKIYRNYQQKWVKIDLKINSLNNYNNTIKNQERILPEFLQNKTGNKMAFNPRYFSFFANKSFFGISRDILIDLKKLFWKSYWFRSNLNPYLNRMKNYLAEMKESTKNYHLNLSIKNFFLKESTFSKNEEYFWRFSLGNEKVRNSRNFRKNSNNLELYGNINIKNYLQSETYLNSTFSKNWQITTNLIEYQRIIFQRIQEAILHMKKNLKLNGQTKAHPSKIGYQKLQTPKSVKKFWVKFGKAIPLEIHNNGPINFYGDISKVRTMWTLNKSNLAYFKVSNKRKNIWINCKLREQKKNNKTKKIMYQMKTKLNNFLNGQDIMTGKGKQFSNFNFSEILAIKSFFNKFIINNLSSERENNKTNPIYNKTSLEEELNSLKDVDYNKRIAKVKRSLEIYESKLRQKENKLSYLGFLNKKINKFPLKKYEFRELKKQLLTKFPLNQKFKIKTSFLSESFILKNSKSLKINLVKPTYLNLIFFNKFTNEYNHWWNSFSFHLIPEFKNIANLNGNTNYIKNFYSNDLIVWVSTFLFHFCALLFLINSAEIRELIKFSIIVFSSILKIYLDISFKVYNIFFENLNLFNSSDYNLKYFSQNLKNSICIKEKNKKMKQFYLNSIYVNKVWFNQLLKLNMKSTEISFSPFNFKFYNRTIQFFLSSKMLDQPKQKSLNVMFDPNSRLSKVTSKNKIKTYNINFFGELIYLSFLSILTKILLGKNKRNLLLFNKKISSREVKTNLFEILNYSKDCSNFVWSDGLTILKEKQNFYLNEYKLFDKKLVGKAKLTQPGTASLCLGRFPTSLSLNFRNKNVLKNINKKIFPLTKYYLATLLKNTVLLWEKSLLYIYCIFLKSLEIFQFTIGCIYLFFEKPGELVLDWIAYAFLVKWSSDVITTIPDVVDSSRMYSFLKISRGVRPFLITNSFYRSPILNNSFLFSLNVLFSGLFQRRMLNVYETIIGKWYQPENDLNFRQKKGIIFWDLWSEVLIEIAEDANINLSELTSLKEEQTRLLERLEEYELQDFQESFINLTNKTSQIKNMPSIAKLCQVAQTKFELPTLKEKKSSLKENKAKNMKKNFDFIQRKPYYFFKNNYFDDSSYKNEKIQDFTLKTLALIHKIERIDKKFENQFQRNWSVDQFFSYQGKNTELFIQKSPSKSFSNIPSIKYSQSILQPIGTIVCQIFSGLFNQQIAKNILIISSSSKFAPEDLGLNKSPTVDLTKLKLNKSSSFQNLKKPNKYFLSKLREGRSTETSRVGKTKNETLFIQAIAGETELKLIIDNAHRYSMIYSGVAIGIKLLKDVFEALYFHTPCIFLLEDIHHIGVRRPFLISDQAEIGKDNEFGAEKEEIHEKNQVIYELSKHLITDYKKPYKGDSSLLIPTNHFCFNLFLGVSSPQIRNNLIPLSNPLNSDSSNEVKDLSSNSKDENQSKSSGQGESKNNNLSTSLQIKSNNLLAPLATSPFSVLLLKEDTKLTHKQVVKEIPWAGFAAEKLALISKSNYSIRVKIALLADIALSNLSIKLDMITDLLVIIDSVKGNRGFIVFATTHIPYILDPALRRPGRFDETISLPLIPNLFSRWEILKTNLQNLTKSSPYSSFSRGLSIDFTNISGIFTSTHDLSKFSHKFLTFNTKLKFQQSGSISMKNNFNNGNLLSNYLTLTYYLNNKNEQFIYPFQIKNYLFKKNIKSLDINLTLKKIFNSIKNLITLSNQNNKNYCSKIFINIVARTYFYVSQILTNFSLQENYLPKVSSSFINIKLKNKLEYSNSTSNIVKLEIITKIDQKDFDTKLQKKEETIFTIPPTDFFIFDSNLYLSFYTSKKTLKKYLTHLISGKLGELFIFSSNNYESNSKSYSKSNHFIANTGLINLYGIDKTWQSATSLLFSLITKRYIYNKNLIIPKLLYFSNYSSLYDTPTPPASNILLPLKRYENYRKTFYTEQIKNKANFEGKTLQDILELHQQQRFIKRLYKVPLREFFRSEIINEKLIGFSNSLIALPPIEKTINFSTNINWYYRNRILNRHRNYLNNQWWNGQLNEHNGESTFLSEIDWRSTFVKSIGDIFIDFPDSDQFYHVKNRRWMLSSNSWKNWFSFEKTNLDMIFNQYMFDCFIQAYNSLDQYREILDFYAFTSLNECMLKEFKEITIINLFKRFSNCN